MSSDKRKQARTQGRFASHPQQSENKNKGRENQRRAKNGSAEDCRGNGDEIDPKELTSGQEPSHVVDDENSMRMTYVENSSYDIPILEPRKLPVEIKDKGMKVLSETENGESRILYYPSFMDVASAYPLYDDLKLNTKWSQLSVVIRGKEYPQPRLVAWFGPFAYGYSGVRLQPQEMPNNILELKRKIEDFLAKDGVDVEFNSVLLNLYQHGKHSVAWHSDDELSMGIHPTIASVSLGEVRKFEMRRKPTADNPEPPVEYYANLKNGSLIVMDGVMQVDWQHRIPKVLTQEVCTRINLTFRKVHQIERP